MKTFLTLILLISIQHVRCQVQLQYGPTAGINMSGFPQVHHLNDWQSVKNIPLLSPEIGGFFELEYKHLVLSSGLNFKYTGYSMQSRSWNNYNTQKLYTIDYGSSLQLAKFSVPLMIGFKILVSDHSLEFKGGAGIDYFVGGSDFKYDNSPSHNEAATLTDPFAAADYNMPAQRFGKFLSAAVLFGICHRADVEASFSKGFGINYENYNFDGNWCYTAMGNSFNKPDLTLRFRYRLIK